LRDRTDYKNSLSHIALYLDIISPLLHHRENAMNKRITCFSFLARLFTPSQVRKEYYPSGKLKSETRYINGQLNGIQKGYYESGKLSFEMPFNNGKLNGVQKEYYESGQLESERTYRDGERNGVLKKYYKSGDLMKEVLYKNGKGISGYLYDLDGKKRKMTDAHFHVFNPEDY